MSHHYSLAHLTVLTLDPPRLIDVAASAGYRYASLRITRVTDSEPLYDLARDRALMRETQARLAASGIAVNDVELFRLDPTLEPEHFVRELEATAELGAHHVIAQLPDPVEARAADRYGRLCDLARPLGITVDLEFPHWTEVGDLDSAVRILRATGRENAGLLIDTLHFGRSHSSAEALDELPRAWFHFAHVCDAERTVPVDLQSVLHTARDERLFPGEGTIDVRGILSHLPQGIPYSLEIPRVMLTRAVGPEQVARLALKVTRTYFGE